jgi:hypothetical protein
VKQVLAIDICVKIGSRTPVTHPVAAPPDGPSSNRLIGNTTGCTGGS